AIGGLLEAGAGTATAASLDALAAQIGADVDAIRALAADGGAGWRLVEAADGSVRLEELADADRDEVIAAIDAGPDDEAPRG
ncbi:MAG: hypothetical protein H0W25_06155, partial [Acidimicrobiia bacterium]|nr:hypothetical protein [Acidimicrobiia bacterium]